MINRVKKLLMKNKIIGTLKYSNDSEIQEIIAYLKRHKLTYFNYEWFHKNEVDKMYDIRKDENERFYVYLNGYKLYMKKGWGEDRIREYMSNLLPEQDSKSPHLYFAEGEMKEHYKCVVDAGVAEGIFALTILDRVEKLYLIEYDEEWLEALELTFGPYKHKVYIISKYLGKDNNDSCCSLDELLKDTVQIDLVKMDIEGAELSALVGGTHVLKNIECLLVCVYHYQDEEQEVIDFFDMAESGKFIITPRRGYIFFLHDKNQKYPYLRRGVLRIERVL